MYSDSQPLYLRSRHCYIRMNSAGFTVLFQECEVEIRKIVTITANWLSENMFRNRSNLNNQNPQTGVEPMTVGLVLDL